MRWRLVGLSTLVLSGDALRLLKVLPEKDTLNGKEAIVAKFDEPIVPLGSDIGYGTQLPEKYIPFEITSSPSRPINGSFYWMSSTLVRFDPTNDWPYDCEITLEFNKNLQSASAADDEAENGASNPRSGLIDFTPLDPSTVTPSVDGVSNNPIVRSLYATDESDSFVTSPIATFKTQSLKLTIARTLTTANSTLTTTYDDSRIDSSSMDSNVFNDLIREGTNKKPSTLFEMAHDQQRIVLLFNYPVELAMVKQYFSFTNMRTSVSTPIPESLVANCPASSSSSTCLEIIFDKKTFTSISNDDGVLQADVYSVNLAEGVEYHSSKGGVTSNGGLVSEEGVRARLPFVLIGSNTGSSIGDERIRVVFRHGLDQSAGFSAKDFVTKAFVFTPAINLSTIDARFIPETTSRRLMLEITSRSEFRPGRYFRIQVNSNTGYVDEFQSVLRASELRFWFEQRSIGVAMSGRDTNLILPSQIQWTDEDVKDVSMEFIITRSPFFEQDKTEIFAESKSNSNIALLLASNSEIKNCTMYSAKVSANATTYEIANLIKLKNSSTLSSLQKVYTNNKLDWKSSGLTVTSVALPSSSDSPTTPHVVATPPFFTNSAFRNSKTGEIAGSIGSRLYCHACRVNNSTNCNELYTGAGQFMSISSFNAFATVGVERDTNKAYLHVTVANWQTAAGVKDATVRVFYTSSSNLASVKEVASSVTDSNGIVKIELPRESVLSVSVFITDKYSQQAVLLQEQYSSLRASLDPAYFYTPPESDSDSKGSLDLSLNMDRSIYQPGSKMGIVGALTVPSQEVCDVESTAEGSSCSIISTKYYDQKNVNKDIWLAFPIYFQAPVDTAVLPSIFGQAASSSSASSPCMVFTTKVDPYTGTFAGELDIPENAPYGTIQTRMNPMIFFNSETMPSFANQTDCGNLVYNELKVNIPDDMQVSINSNGASPAIANPRPPTVDLDQLKIDAGSANNWMPSVLVPYFIRDLMSTNSISSPSIEVKGDILLMSGLPYKNASVDVVVTLPGVFATVPNSPKVDLNNYVSSSSSQTTVEDVVIPAVVYDSSNSDGTVKQISVNFIAPGDNSSPLSSTFTLTTNDGALSFNFELLNPDSINLDDKITINYDSSNKVKVDVSTIGLSGEKVEKSMSGPTIHYINEKENLAQVVFRSEASIPGVPFDVQVFNKKNINYYYSTLDTSSSDSSSIVKDAKFFFVESNIPDVYATSSTPDSDLSSASSSTSCPVWLDRILSSSSSSSPSPSSDIVLNGKPLDTSDFNLTSRLMSASSTSPPISSLHFIPSAIPSCTGDGNSYRCRVTPPPTNRRLILLALRNAELAWQSTPSAGSTVTVPVWSCNFVNSLNSDDDSSPDVAAAEASNSLTATLKLSPLEKNSLASPSVFHSPLSPSVTSPFSIFILNNLPVLSPSIRVLATSGSYSKLFTNVQSNSDGYFELKFDSAPSTCVNYVKDCAIALFMLAPAASTYQTLPTYPSFSGVDFVNISSVAPFSAPLKDDKQDEIIPVTSEFSLSAPISFRLQDSVTFTSPTAAKESNKASVSSITFQMSPDEKVTKAGGQSTDVQPHTINLQENNTTDSSFILRPQRNVTMTITLDRSVKRAAVLVTIQDTAHLALGNPIVPVDFTQMYANRLANLYVSSLYSVNSYSTQNDPIEKKRFALLKQRLREICNASAYKFSSFRSNLAIPTLARNIFNAYLDSNRTQLPNSTQQANDDDSSVVITALTPMRPQARISFFPALLYNYGVGGLIRNFASSTTMFASATLMTARGEAVPAADSAVAKVGSGVSDSSGSNEAATGRKAEGQPLLLSKVVYFYNNGESLNESSVSFITGDQEGTFSVKTIVFSDEESTTATNKFGLPMSSLEASAEQQVTFVSRPQVYLRLKTPQYARLSDQIVLQTLIFDGDSVASSASPICGLELTIRSGDGFVITKGTTTTNESTAFCIEDQMTTITYTLKALKLKVNEQITATLAKNGIILDTLIATIDILAPNPELSVSSLTILSVPTSSTETVTATQEVSVVEYLNFPSDPIEGRGSINHAVAVGSLSALSIQMDSPLSNDDSTALPISRAVSLMHKTCIYKGVYEQNPPETLIDAISQSVQSHIFDDGMRWTTDATSTTEASLSLTAATLFAASTCLRSAPELYAKDKASFEKLMRSGIALAEQKMSVYERLVTTYGDKLIACAPNVRAYIGVRTLALMHLASPEFATALKNEKAFQIKGDLSSLWVSSELSVEKIAAEKFVVASTNATEISGYSDVDATIDLMMLSLTSASNSASSVPLSELTNLSLLSPKGTSFASFSTTGDANSDASDIMQVLAVSAWARKFQIGKVVKQTPSVVSVELAARLSAFVVSNFGRNYDLTLENSLFAWNAISSMDTALFSSSLPSSVESSVLIRTVNDSATLPFSSGEIALNLKPLTASMNLTGDAIHAYGIASHLSVPSGGPALALSAVSVDFTPSLPLMQSSMKGLLVNSIISGPGENGKCKLVSDSQWKKLNSDPSSQQSIFQTSTGQTACISVRVASPVASPGEKFRVNLNLPAGLEFVSETPSVVWDLPLTSLPNLPRPTDSMSDWTRWWIPPPCSLDGSVAAPENANFTCQLSTSVNMDEDSMRSVQMTVTVQSNVEGVFVMPGVKASSIEDSALMGVSQAKIIQIGNDTSLKTEGIMTASDYLSFVNNPYSIVVESSASLMPSAVSFLEGPGERTFLRGSVRR